MPDAPAGSRTPVVLLGGTANALSLTRSLGRRQVPVYSLNQAWPPIRHSRFARLVPLPDGDLQQAWKDWLTSEHARHLQGAVLLPCSDDGLEFVARNSDWLADRFRLIEGDPRVLLAMLDKARTYELARQLGIPVPATSPVEDLQQALSASERIGYPVGLKPRHSHTWQRLFGNKLFVVSGPEELTQVFKRIEEKRPQVLVTEMIQGAEERFCSYYTYLDERLSPLFHFTKRKLRQYPLGRGQGTYHVSDWNPEVAELGLRFLQGVGLVGFGNVEFKRDARDERLKLIECNARFTLLHEMLEIAGIDLSLLVYNRLTGRALPKIGEYRRGVRVLLPLNDLRYFREAHRRGEMSWAEWLGSLCHRLHFLYFRWSDPGPSAAQAWAFVSRQLRGPFGRRKRESGPG